MGSALKVRKNVCGRRSGIRRLTVEDYQHPDVTLTYYGGAGGKLRQQRPAIGEVIPDAIDTESKDPSLVIHYLKG